MTMTSLLARLADATGDAIRVAADRIRALPDLQLLEMASFVRQAADLEQLMTEQAPAKKKVWAPRRVVIAKPTSKRKKQHRKASKQVISAEPIERVSDAQEEAATSAPGPTRRPSRPSRPNPPTEGATRITSLLGEHPEGLTVREIANHLGRPAMGLGGTMSRLGDRVVRGDDGRWRLA